MIHSELNLLYGTGMVKLIFQHIDTQLSPKAYPFSTELPLHAYFLNSFIHLCVGMFLFQFH